MLCRLDFTAFLNHTSDDGSPLVLLARIILSAAYDAAHNANRRLVNLHFNLRPSHLCNLYATDDNAAVLLPITATIV